MWKYFILFYLVLGWIQSSLNGQIIIDGYTDKLSYCPGERAVVYINADTEGFRTIALQDIHGKPVGTVASRVYPQDIDNRSPWRDGFGYRPTFSYRIPNIKSGIYFWEHKIPFIVKQDTSEQTPFPYVVVVLQTNTDAAYNNCGGKSLYSYNSLNGQRADTVSFHRPCRMQYYPFAFLRWVWNQYDFGWSYVADIDLEDFASISRADLIIITGHSEYWTRVARRNFDRHVSRGKPALILSGNTMWWQVRYSDDKSQLICHKDWASDGIPCDSLKTIQWMDTSLVYSTMSSIGADFDHGGFGLHEDSGWDGFKIIAADPPYISNLGITEGQIISLPTYEYDGTLIWDFDDNGYPRPDTAALGFHYIRIIGFDLGFRLGETIATWLEFQNTRQSGRVINTASTNWCSSTGLNGQDGQLLQSITLQMIEYLLDPDSAIASNRPPAVRLPSDSNTPALYSNYPNPFNPATTIGYDLPHASEVSLIIYDLLGREVARPVDSYMEPGYYEVEWDGSDFVSGIYIARLVTPEYSKSIKMVLLK